MNKIIDINCDVGEGLNNEAQFMPFISSCNIACGGHAGNLQTMQFVISLAKQYGVKVGAHPSFPDKKNFGRIAMQISPDALKTSILQQTEILINLLNAEKMELHHIKPHGALYNLAAKQESIATILVEVMKQLPKQTKLFVPYNSVIEKLALREHIAIIYEAFADRNYNDDLTLVSRQNKHAIIDDFCTLFEHVFSMISTQKVKTITGNNITIKADTFCIHGDNPNAVELIKKLTQKLAKNHIKVK